MRKATARFVEWLLRLLVPVLGRHQDADVGQGVQCVGTPTVPRPRVCPRSIRPSGGESAEGHREDRPRAVLVCAPHGMVVIR